jgi:hypothetical protein
MGTKSDEPLGEGENDELLIRCEVEDHGDYDARFGADCPMCKEVEEFEHLVPEDKGWASACDNPVYAPLGARIPDPKETPF